MANSKSNIKDLLARALQMPQAERVEFLKTVSEDIFLGDRDRDRFAKAFSRVTSYQSRLYDRQRADGDEFANKDVLRQILEAFDGYDAGRMDLGPKITSVVKNGRRYPVKRSLALPHSGDSDSPFASAMRIFRDRFVTNPGETYATSDGRVYDGRELLEKHGVVYGQAARDSMMSYLSSAAEESAIGFADVARLGSRVGANPREVSAIQRSLPEYKQAQLQRARGRVKKLAGGGSGGNGGGRRGRTMSGSDDDGDEIREAQREQREEEAAERRANMERARKIRESRRSGLTGPDAIRSAQREADGVLGRINDGIGADDVRGERESLRLKQQASAAAKQSKTATAVAGGLAFFEVLKGVGESVESGAQVGKAVGGLAANFNHAVVSAAGAFQQIGTTMLGLILSPLGGVGSGVTSIAGGIGQAVVGGLQAGGSLIAAGVRLGTAVGTGMLMGLGTVFAAGVGGLIGLAVGGGPGAAAGASIGATIGAGVAGAIGTLVSGVGGAIGQALKAIGDAFGQIANGLVGALNNIKDILGDLVQSGVTFANATLTVQRTAGIGLGGAAKWTALSQVITGKPGGLNGMYDGFGMMSPYLAARASAFHVSGVDPNNPLTLISGAFKRYQELGASGAMGGVQQRILLQGMFPGVSDQVGGLFARGPQAVGLALKTARSTAMTPAEVQRDALLGQNLDVIDARMTRLKTRFLSDLMPAINTGLQMFGHWFETHEASIIKMLENIGHWFAVKFPSYIRSGIDALFRLGETFTGLLSTTLAWAGGAIAGIATVVQAINPLLKVVTFGRVQIPVPNGDAVAAMAVSAGGMGVALEADRKRTLAGFDKTFGSEAQRESYYRQFGQASSKQQKLDLYVHNDPEAIAKLSAKLSAQLSEKVLDQSAEQWITAEQRGG